MVYMIQSRDWKRNSSCGLERQGKCCKDEGKCMKFDDVHGGRRPGRYQKGELLVDHVRN